MIKNVYYLNSSCSKFVVHCRIRAWKVNWPSEHGPINKRPVKSHVRSLCTDEFFCIPLFMLYASFKPGVISINSWAPFRYFRACAGKTVIATAWLELSMTIFAFDADCALKCNTRVFIGVIRHNAFRGGGKNGFIQVGRWHNAYGRA